MILWAYLGNYVLNLYLKEPTQVEPILLLL